MQFTHTTPLGHTVAFVAADATPKPGPRRPYNFFGTLGRSELDALQGLLQKHANASHTIVFGHYPIATVVSQRSSSGLTFDVAIVYSCNVQELLGKFATAYLCGHLHTLFGLARPMHALHASGVLELELADWKDNRFVLRSRSSLIRRAFRIVAFDRGMVSAVDSVHGLWPVVLFTSPKVACRAVLTPGRSPSCPLEGAPAGHA